MFPSDPDALLVQGFVEMHSGNLDGAAVAFNALGDSAEDSLDSELAGRLLHRVQVRRGVAGSESPAAAVPSPEIERFFDDPGIRALRDLPIR